MPTTSLDSWRPGLNGLDEVSRSFRDRFAELGEQHRLSVMATELRLRCRKGGVLEDLLAVLRLTSWTSQIPQQLWPWPAPAKLQLAKPGSEIGVTKKPGTSVAAACIVCGRPVHRRHPEVRCGLVLIGFLCEV